jgi:hypothetical protein
MGVFLVTRTEHGHQRRIPSSDGPNPKDPTCLPVFTFDLLAHWRRSTLRISPNREILEARCLAPPHLPIKAPISFAPGYPKGTPRILPSLALEVFLLSGARGSNQSADAILLSGRCRFINRQAAASAVLG